MKNVLIAVLIIVVTVLGYLVIFDTEEAIEPTNTNTDTSSSEVPVTQNEVSVANSGLETLPQDLFNNSATTSLDVSGNNLTGALPAEIRQLSNLEVLIASDNQLTGIPAEIGQLSKLRYVDFSNNQITGLPLEIGNMQSLETLDLRGNPNVSTYDLDKIRPNIPNAEILVD